MSDSNSHSKHNSNDDESSLEIQALGPKIQKNSSSNTNNYMKILSRNEKIDEEAILQEFNTINDYQRRQSIKMSQSVNKKKKNQKAPVNSSKKSSFGYMKKKWKAEIDQNIELYKQYLIEHKKAYDGKQKEFLLDFFKILLDGYFQLKDYYQSSPSDPQKNQIRIISSECLIFDWLRSIVDIFDSSFKQAKVNNKIVNTKDKWDALIMNCRDQSNFELRRRIIRAKIKPIDVIQNDNRFLMSEQARTIEQRQRKLVLAQADKKFEDPLYEERIQSQIEDQRINEIPEQLQTLRSLSSYDNFQRKINQEKDKLEEYKQFIGDQPDIRLKDRINQLLKGTSSYDRIMGDFLSKFKNC